jgi:hypothetical protein
VALFGVDPSGGDVFFTTADQLVPQDAESQMVLYDAREEGGFPAPLLAPGCVGETCRGTPAAAPMFATPSSATFSGSGNLPPPVKAVVLTRAQKLAKALKACRTKHNKHKRVVCERQARKRYGPTKAKKASHTATTHKGGK